MPKHLFIFCLFVFLLPVSSNAQNLKAQVNKTHLEASEILKLDLTIFSRKRIEKPSFPELTGFRKGKLISPKVSRGSRRKVTYSQLYFPLAKGDFKIPSFPVYVEDRKIFTDPISGKVVDDSEIPFSFKEVDFPVELISYLEPIDVYKGQAVRLDLCLKLDEPSLQNFSFPDLEKIEQEIIAQIDEGLFDWEVGDLPRDPVPVDAIPDIGENQQIVFTEWMGRSPQDVEDQITYPLTTALLGIAGVKGIRSNSMFGFSSIYIIFDSHSQDFKH